MKNKNNKPKNFIFAVPKFKYEYFGECENLKLILDKYLKFEEKKGTFYFSKDTINTIKNEAFKKIKNYSKEKCNKLINQVNSLQSMITSEKITLTTKSRLVVGLGISSVLEVSIRLHHIYGIPYIPSTAIKGVLRAYNILKEVDFDLEKYKDLEKEIEKFKIEKEDDLKKAPENIKKIIELFGNQSYKEQLTVLDAFPESCPEFEEDIINVHFQEYYQNKKPPAENMKPIPVKFLTIKKGTKFNFYFINSKIYEDKTKRNIKEDLIDATKYFGIGAKTSIGYGVFE